MDVYDLILFSILRIPSLKALGFSDDLLVSHGILLLNLQMLGMLAGGIFFGILCDRMGRVALLFGSILLYYIANVANGFVHTIEAYGYGASSLDSDWRANWAAASRSSPKFYPKNCVPTERRLFPLSVFLAQSAADSSRKKWNGARPISSAAAWVWLFFSCA